MEALLLRASSGARTRYPERSRLGPGASAHPLLLRRVIAIAQATGSTPLYIACQQGHRDTAALLLDKGSTAMDTPNVAAPPSPSSLSPPGMPV